MPQKSLTPVARKLRANQTEAEAKLWSRLRANQLEGYKFRRQFPIGRHIADFACQASRLVIELDGGQHAEQSEADALRTSSIEAAGFTVLRFWNNDVMDNIEGVLEEIRQTLLFASNR